MVPAHRAEYADGGRGDGLVKTLLIAWYMFVVCLYLDELTEKGAVTF